MLRVTGGGQVLAERGVELRHPPAGPAELLQQRERLGGDRRAVRVGGGVHVVAVVLRPERVAVVVPRPHAPVLPAEVVGGEHPRVRDDHAGLLVRGDEARHRVGDPGLAVGLHQPRQPLRGGLPHVDVGLGHLEEVLGLLPVGDADEPGAGRDLLLQVGGDRGVVVAVGELGLVPRDADLGALLGEGGDVDEGELLDLGDAAELAEPVGDGPGAEVHPEDRSGRRGWRRGGAGCRRRRGDRIRGRNGLGRGAGDDGEQLLPRLDRRRRQPVPRHQAVPVGHPELGRDLRQGVARLHRVRRGPGRGQLAGGGGERRLQTGDGGLVLHRLVEGVGPVGDGLGEAGGAEDVGGAHCGASMSRSSWATVRSLFERQVSPSTCRAQVRTFAGRGAGAGPGAGTGGAGG
jgi:hypothetical protein